ncbi:hypothetical protein ABFU45_08775 [Xanthomonas campestris pv. raphani]|uniref:hypothetical protein n=1 Tax=Xanthomonas campestris TaxID=339 RepID=UPI00388E1C15
MFRDCLLLCVYLLSAVPATLLAKPKEAPTSPRAYIETSYLIAPRTVGPFSLARRAYTPDAKAPAPLSITRCQANRIYRSMYSSTHSGSAIRRKPLQRAWRHFAKTSRRQ